MKELVDLCEEMQEFARQKKPQIRRTRSFTTFHLIEREDHVKKKVLKKMMTRVELQEAYVFDMMSLNESIYEKGVDFETYNHKKEEQRLTKTEWKA